jgi:hypothetical protein
VVRADFESDSAWREIERIARAPVGAEGFLAYLEFLDDRSYEGVGPAELVALARARYGHGFIVLADALSMSHPDHPVLVIDLGRDRGRSFRAIPSALQSVENNLSLANLDFADFAEAADATDDQILRELTG